MSDCIYVTLLSVLFLKAFGVEEEAALCQMMGSPEFPLLSKDGDIIIGGAFSIHSQVSKPALSFIDPPEHLQCSRYCQWSTVSFFFCF